MNKRDEAIEKFREEFKRKSEDLIDFMQSATDDMLEHECWFDVVTCSFPIYLNCRKCTSGAVTLTLEDVERMYNAMRHLTPELLMDAAQNYGYFSSEDRRAFGAAAKAMRHE